VICDHVLGQHLVEADSVGQVVRGHDADSSVAIRERTTIDALART
jgi:hypothetical protein